MHVFGLMACWLDFGWFWVRSECVELKCQYEAAVSFQLSHCHIDDISN